MPTAKHGWASAHQTVSMLRSIYRRPWVDHERLQYPVEPCLAAAGRFNIMRRRISTPAEPPPRRWSAGIEAHDVQPAVRVIPEHTERVPPFPSTHTVCVVFLAHRAAVGEVRPLHRLHWGGRNWIRSETMGLAR